LNRKITLIDGGMGQELIHRSKIKPDYLWSARVLLDHYGLVVDLHKDFINSGAEAITLNSYTITPDRLKKFNLEDSFKPLQESAIKAAKEAINSFSKKANISLLGSLPPLIMSYKTELGKNKNEAKDIYKRIVEIQQQHVDIFVCETVSSIEEAEVVTEAALGSEKKVWLSFCVKEEDGTQLRSGESLEDALNQFENTEINSLLVNCAPPEAIHQSISIMKKLKKPFGGLPNGFKSVNLLNDENDVSILEKRDDFNIDKFVKDTLRFIENNASIVGGCCEVSPKYIKALKNKIQTIK
jgi:S-methylmethionine-dependent homocysteine/selenocysteine methylase